MAVIYNADEVLAMAEQIERNGRKFYLRGAEIAAEPEANKLLVDLAEWEKSHEALFASMRADLSPEQKVAAVFDADNDAELYLRAAADSHVFNVHKEIADILSGDEDAIGVLEKALSFERDSILFFVGMTKAVPERFGIDKVNRVVQEEMNHVAYLKKKIRELEG